MSGSTACTGEFEVLSFGIIDEILVISCIVETRRRRTARLNWLALRVHVLSSSLKTVSTATRSRSARYCREFSRHQADLTRIPFGSWLLRTITSLTPFQCLVFSGCLPWHCCHFVCVATARWWSDLLPAVSHSLFFRAVDSCAL